MKKFKNRFIMDGVGIDLSPKLTKQEQQKSDELDKKIKKKFSKSKEN